MPRHEACMHSRPAQNVTTVQSQTENWVVKPAKSHQPRHTNVAAQNPTNTPVIEHLSGSEERRAQIFEWLGN